MASEMIENASHALRIADDCDFHDGENKDYNSMVRAVLQAIREPTGEMLQAGNRVWLDGGNERQIYEAMIDAALAE